MSRPRKVEVQVSNEQMRKTLQDDVRAFLDAGNKIEQIPTGYSAQDPSAGRRHIVLAPSKRS
jgi:hypothetical protein